MEKWNIIKKIDELNQNIKNEFLTDCESDDSFEEMFIEATGSSVSIFEYGDLCTERDLVNLDKIIHMPASLLDFYQQIGHISQKSCYLPSVKVLIETFYEDSVFKGNGHVNRLGLIDMILNSWGNDRFEFQGPEEFPHISDENIAFINEQYKCIGWFQPIDDESFSYLIFNKSGQFNTVWYHQDYFGEFITEYFIPLLNGQLKGWNDFYKTIINSLEEVQAEKNYLS